MSSPKVAGWSLQLYNLYVPFGFSLCVNAYRESVGYAANDSRLGTMAQCDQPRVPYLVLLISRTLCTFY